MGIEGYAHSGLGTAALLGKFCAKPPGTGRAYDLGNWVVIKSAALLSFQLET